MFSVKTGVLGQLVASLLQSEDNVIEELIVKKIEEIGKDFVADLIRETPLGAAFGVTDRLAKAIESGGASEFKRARAQWLNALKKPINSFGSGSSRMGAKIQKALQKSAQDSSRPEDGHWKWSRSRQEWLNEDWRHDWRSQPRDKRGRWIPGRLNTIYVSQTLRKRRASRRKMIRK